METSTKNNFPFIQNVLYSEFYTKFHKSQPESRLTNAQIMNIMFFIARLARKINYNIRH
jgi:hypothetical protein